MIHVAYIRSWKAGKTLATIKWVFCVCVCVSEAILDMESSQLHSEATITAPIFLISRLRLRPLRKLAKATQVIGSLLTWTWTTDLSRSLTSTLGSGLCLLEHGHAHDFVWFSQVPCEEKESVHLSEKVLRCREVNWLAQGHTANQSLAQNWNYLHSPDFGGERNYNSIIYWVLTVFEANILPYLNFSTT